MKYFPSATSSQASNTLDLDQQGGHQGSTEDCNLEAEGFSHEDVLEDIEDGTSSVLSSSSLSGASNECLAFRAPWATPPTATFEGKPRNPVSRNTNQLQANSNALAWTVLLYF